MSNTFTVNAGELWKMAATASGLTYELDDDSVNRDALAGVSGSGDVEGAYHGFVREWSDGLEKIRGHLQELSDRLAAAAGAYTQTEKAVMSAAEGGGT